uniref:Uncharacterized protein n=1 Tax=uncultured prokaryote TaxID=198431 RepID=A0A0H5Q3I2_9ZZZZ|nr:hypothetical protein [uncultured prokaryote]
MQKVLASRTYLLRSAVVMGTPVLLDGYRAQLLFSAPLGGRPWSTKFDYVQTSGDEASPEKMAEVFTDALDTQWNTPTGTLEMSDMIQSACDLTAIRVYQLTDPLQGVENAPPGTITTAGVDSMPAEVAMVASLRTAKLGRRYRGRQYWGGLAEPVYGVEFGIMNTGYREMLATFVDGMRLIGDLDVDFQMAVISGQGLDIDRPPGLATAVTSVLVDAFPDTQRRRGGR